MLGMLLGYLIRHKPNLYFGGQIGEFFIWIITWSLTFWAIYWNKDLFNTSTVLSQTELFSWIAFSKLCYLSGWCWLLYCCCTEKTNRVAAGFLKIFLINVSHFFDYAFDWI
jgi:hypothetical protein